MECRAAFAAETKTKSKAKTTKTTKTVKTVKTETKKAAETTKETKKAAETKKDETKKEESQTEEIETNDPAFLRAYETIRAMLSKRGYFDLPAAKAGDAPRTKFSDHDGLTWKRNDENDKIWVLFSAQLTSTEAYDALLQESGVERAIVATRTLATKRKLSERYEVFTFAELGFDVTAHHLQPEFVVLSDSERAAVLKRYSATSAQFPKMRAADPVARFYGAKPGTTFRIERKSDTAGTSVTYRIVVP